MMEILSNTKKLFTFKYLFLLVTALLVTSCGSFGEGLLMGLGDVGGYGYGGYGSSYVASPVGGNMNYLLDPNYAAAQTMAQQQQFNQKNDVVELRKYVREEDDGFVWIEYKTWDGDESINYGAKDQNGNTIIPQKYDFVVYRESDGGYFSVELKGKKGVYTKEGHRICDAIYDQAYYNKEGDDIYVEVVQNGRIGILGKNGNYIISPSSVYKSIFYSDIDNVFKYENASGEYVSTGIDIHGNHVDNNKDESIAKTQTTARTENSGNSNNNKFCYPRCADVKMDSQGNPIKSSIKYVYPTGEASVFMIEFVYEDNNSIPVSVYLKETADDERVVKSELIAAPFKSVTSLVQYNANSVNIFSLKYQVCIRSDGDIIIYDVDKGSYAGRARYFDSGVVEPLYHVRYEVLIENLRKYFKGD